MGNCLRRAQVQSLTWPLLESLNDVALERRLFPAPVVPSAGCSQRRLTDRPPSIPVQFSNAWVSVVGSNEFAKLVKKEAWDHPNERPCAQNNDDWLFGSCVSRR